jgi:L-lactate dehydrogenase complex protein LldG
MSDRQFTEQFSAAARKVGAAIKSVASPAEAAAYIATHAAGAILLPETAAMRRGDFNQLLAQAGAEVITDPSREQSATAVAGVTGANFALADTGTVVLESTDEAIRLATTLPERHFVLLDPRKIIADGAAAVPWLRRFRARTPRHFLAWITGPSRTADIERVLTIGVHGPKELHILLVEGWSEDFLEI